MEVWMEVLLRCSLWFFPTCPLRREEVEVLNVLPESLHILVDCVRRHAANLHQSVVLDEDCVAGQIAVDDWFLSKNINFTSDRTCSD